MRAKRRAPASGSWTRGRGVENLESVLLDTRVNHAGCELHFGIVAVLWSLDLEAM